MLGLERVGFESCWLPLDKSLHAASGSSCLSDRTSFIEGEWMGLEKQGAQRAVGAQHEVDSPVEAFFKFNKFLPVEVEWVKPS